MSPLPIPPQYWFTPKEAARLMGRSPQFIRDCFDSAALMGHTVTARGRGRRRSYQVPRPALLLYLVESANYRPGDYLARVTALVDALDESDRATLRAHLNTPRTSVWARS